LIEHRGDNEDMEGGVGAQLREARVQRGIDLAEIAASTKIQVRFLAAIENEEWGLLPGEFYARSFVGAYAAHLGLDAARVVEELRSAPSLAATADRAPRVDPAPPQRVRSGHRRRLSPRLLAAIATLGLAAVLAVTVLLSPGGDSTGPSSPSRTDSDRQHLTPSPSAGSPRPAVASLMLTATAEVWVCLIDERGRVLIDGQILDPGTEAGPYRSDGFTVSLGNGAVAIRVAGHAASIPPTPNPIGFSIDSHGALRQLPEGERPTCT
jgi:cytoskeleton protein RodZ